MATPIFVMQVLSFTLSREHSESFKLLGYLCLVRLDTFSHATGCTDDQQKCMLLLHTASEEVHDIFVTLADTGAIYN